MSAREPRRASPGLAGRAVSVPAPGEAAFRWQAPAAAVLAALLGAPAAAQSLGAEAPPAPIAGPARPGSRGGAILLEQATYWTAQGRPQLAQQALDRLLMLEPNNPEVLATATEVAAQNGDRPNAETYIARLNGMAPNSPAAQRAVTALRAMLVDQATLAEARRLAQAGQREAAMQHYRDLFPDGDVPPIFAVEYFQTLAGTNPENFDLARAGMEGMIRRFPANSSLRLAYAQILTYSEAYRLTGAEQLRTLADDPAMGSAARVAWRQALLWSPIDPDTAEAIATYLRTNPSDPEIQAKYDEARGTVLPAWVLERITGWNAFGEKRFEDAERHFRAVLEGDPADAEAYIGLCVIRKMQFRFAEARAFFAKAVELAPYRQEEFVEKTGNLDGFPATARGTANRGARGGPPAPPGNAALAWQSLGRNAVDRAADHAQRALRGSAGERLQGEVVLGLVAMRRDDLSTAETRFRNALAIRPTEVSAQGGLFEALQRQGRFAEADRVLAETGFRPPDGARSFRAAALRGEAQRTRDRDARIALLRGAVAADPADAWSTFDLARNLKERGQVDEARRLERDLAARNTPDALFAASLLSNADGRMAETVSRLDAIPPAARTEDGRRLLEANRRILEIRGLERAAKGDGSSEAARRLVALAAQPDPGGETAAAVIRAFNRLRQPRNAEAAARAASASTPAARIAIAAALLEGGQVLEAEALAAGVERDAVAPGEIRRQAAGLRAASAAAAADRLNDRGERQAAMSRLAPALSGSPENADVQLTLARVHAGSGRAEEGLRIAEGILSASPDNVRARAVAGEAAVLANAIGRAEAILREGRERGADELQMALLEARIARARDDRVRARRALEEAARLRARQLQAGSQAGP